MRVSTCLYCSTEFKYKSSSTGKYCSNTCQHNYQKQKRIEEWLNGGRKPGRGNLIEYLDNTYGHKCSCCNLKSWMGKDITLEIDHADGNPYNNSPSNLRYLCPNCHSQTESYKGKNKGKGRMERRDRANKNYQREREAKSLNLPL
jgi:hypothetical protein